MRFFGELEFGGVSGFEMGIMGGFLLLGLDLFMIGFGIMFGLGKLIVIVYLSG